MNSAPCDVFECGNTKCANAIASEGINSVQLKALRRWAKTCDRCGKATHWQEKVLLLNTNTTISTNGGSKNANQNTLKNQSRAH